MSAEPATPAGQKSCPHVTRARDVLSGFASAETICASCGEVFDAEEEQHLRTRDRAAHRENPDVGRRKGYVVG